MDRFWGYCLENPKKKIFTLCPYRRDGFESQGVDNPYKYGVIGSSDTHLGIPGAVDESQFYGHGGAGKIAERK